MRTAPESLAVIAGALGAGVFFVVAAIADGMPERARATPVRAAAADLPEYSLLGGDVIFGPAALAVAPQREPVRPSSIDGALVTMPNVMLRALAECAPPHVSLAAMQRTFDADDPSGFARMTETLLTSETWCGPSASALRTAREIVGMALRHQPDPGREPVPEPPGGETPGGPGGPGYQEPA